MLLIDKDFKVMELQDCPAGISPGVVMSSATLSTACTSNFSAIPIIARAPEEYNPKHLKQKRHINNKKKKKKHYD